MSKTRLKDRTLYFDGDSVVDAQRAVEFIEKGLTVCVEEQTDEIRNFNKLVPTGKQIKVKDGIRPFEFDWNIPEPYKSWTNQDVIDYVIDKCCEHSALDDTISSEEADARAMRVSDELHLYRKLNLLPILRTIIYVINTLQEKEIVWGVGRGSSVSSYVLYLIGVHDVDSVKYDLNITDFLRLPTS